VVEAVLDEFDSYLELQCLRSAHTRRAYLGDLRSLFAFLTERAPGTGLQGLSLPILRSWLAAGAGAGVARTTLARRTSAVKSFTAWAVRRGLLAGDPATRLQVPKARRALRRCCGKIRRLPPCRPRNPARSKVIRWPYAIA